MKCTCRTLSKDWSKSIMTHQQSQCNKDVDISVTPPMWTQHRHTAPSEPRPKDEAADGLRRIQEQCLHNLRLVRFPQDPKPYLFKPALSVTAASAAGHATVQDIYDGPVFLASVCANNLGPPSLQVFCGKHLCKSSVQDLRCNYSALQPTCASLLCKICDVYEYCYVFSEEPSAVPSGKQTNI